MKFTGPRETRLPGGAPGGWTDLAACVGDPRFTDPRRSDPPQLAAICSGCPVLPACRDYASRHAWLGVFIGGWLAGANKHVRPPWAATTGNGTRPR